MLSGVLVLAITAGGCTASGTTVSRAAGNTAGHQASAKAAASPSHRPSQPSSVQLVVEASGDLLIPSPPPHPRGQSGGVQLTVEASGDLLIHSPIFDRALALGGGRHYDFAPFFVQIRPYIRGAGLALCHVETPMTPARSSAWIVSSTPRWP